MFAAISGAVIAYIVIAAVVLFLILSSVKTVPQGTVAVTTVFGKFHAVKRTDIYGDDDAAALRDLLFSWWEERFLLAHAGAPAIEEA